MGCSDRYVRGNLLRTLKLKWAYGVTTVPERRGYIFEGTLLCLKDAGFVAPRFFVDGAASDEEVAYYQNRGFDCTIRCPRIYAYGNWLLALMELFIRNPNAERYAIFQDDILVVKNLRQYLNRCEFPKKGYWNLYTVPKNEALVPNTLYSGWYESDQKGKGALGLVFNREGLLNLLEQKDIIERPLDCHRGKCGIDGAVVTVFEKLGWKEYVHIPSLVQHASDISTMQSRSWEVSTSFPGYEFDALTLIK